MPLAKFATFALAALLACGACAGEEDARIMQEIQAGNRDVDALLEMLDDDWEAGRKGHK